MTRHQIVAAFVGVVGAVVGAGLGVGPLAYRVLDADWVPGLPLVAAVAAVLGVAAFVLAVIEWAGSSALALIAAVAIAILGATSVVIGMLAGALLGLASWGLGAVMGARRGRLPRSGDLLMESARLDRAARQAGGAERMLLSLAERVDERAASYAEQGRAADAWQTADIASYAQRSARDVASMQQQMLGRRDLYAAEGLRQAVHAQLLPSSSGSRHGRRSR